MNKRYNQTYRDFKSKKKPGAKSAGGLTSLLLGSKKSTKRRVRSQERYAEAAFFGKPHLSSRHKALPIFTKRSLVSFTILALLTAWFGLMFYLPYFNVKISRITGLKSIKYDDIKNIAQTYLNGKSYVFLNNKNYFVTSENILKDQIIQKFYLEDIKITKTFPNSLSIDLQEKISSIIYDNGQQYVLLDQNGTVVQVLKDCTTECITTPAAISPTTTDQMAASTTEPVATPKKHTPKYDSFALEYLDVPIFYDSRNQSVTPGKENILPKDLIKKILEINNRVRKTEKGFSVLYYQYDGEGSEVKAYTDKPYSINFNVGNDLDNQFANIKTVLKDNRPAEYIDVRYNTRVFWK